MKNRQVYHIYIFNTSEFILACVILGMEYLQSKEILHRDIKPENLVCDDKGYVRITDFGIARKLSQCNEKDSSGTLGYMAPEVLNNKKPGFYSDYFALGVIAYEFMLGRKPFRGKTKKEIKENIILYQPNLIHSSIPSNWSSYSGEFINKLIQRKISQRFCCIEDIKNHQWFAGFSWDELKNKTIKSPLNIVKCIHQYDKNTNQNEMNHRRDIKQNKIIISNKIDKTKFKTFSSLEFPEEFQPVNPSLFQKTLKGNEKLNQSQMSNKNKNKKTFSSESSRKTKFRILPTSSKTTPRKTIKITHNYFDQGNKLNDVFSCVHRNNKNCSSNLSNSNINSNDKQRISSVLPMVNCKNLLNDNFSRHDSLPLIGNKIVNKSSIQLLKNKQSCNDFTHEKSDRVHYNSNMN